MSNLSQKKGYKSHLVKKAAVALTVFTMASAGVVAIDSAHSEDAYAATALKKTSVKKFGNLKKGYTVYTGITLTKKAGTTDAHTAKTLYVQYSFQKNGKTYYRVLQNKKHFGVVEAAAFKQAGNGLNYFGAKNVISNRQVQITAKDSIYSNLNSFKVAGSTEDHIGEMTVSNGYFNHYNGQRYYALYQDGKLFGYVNTKALKANATDLTDLNAAIKAADELKAEDYTKASFEAFAKVLDEAKATAKKVGVNKADADAAVKALDDATKALVKELRVESVSAINFTDFKVVFNTEVEKVDEVIVKDKDSNKVYVKAVTLAEDKKSATVTLFDNMKNDQEYSVAVKVADETVEGSFKFVSGTPAAINLTSQNVEATNGTVKYAILDENGLDITKNIPTGYSVSIASDSNKLSLVNGTINSTLVKGESAFLVVTVKDKNAKVVTESNRVTISVDAAAKVAGFGSDWTLGTANFGKEDYKQETSLGMNTSKTIKYSFVDQYGKSITLTGSDKVEYTSLDTNVAIVDKNTGAITPRKQGNVGIRATLTVDGKQVDTKTVEVTVTAEAKLVKLNAAKNEVKITKGASAYSVVIDGEDQFGNKISAGTLSVVADNKDIATATASGSTVNITAVAKGSTFVTVKSGDISTVISVTVSEFGAIKDYSLEGGAEELKTRNDASTTIDDTKLTYSVYGKDENGTLSVNPVAAEFVVTDKDGKTVATSSNAVTSFDVTYNATNYKADETYTVTAKVNSLTVGTSTFKVVDNSISPKVSLENNKFTAEKHDFNKTILNIVENSLKFTAVENTEIAVTDIDFLVNTDSIFSASPVITTSSIDKDGSATVYLNNVTVTVTEKSGETADPKALGTFVLNTVGFDIQITSTVGTDKADKVDEVDVDTDINLVEAGAYEIPKANQTDQETKTAWVKSEVESKLTKGTTATVSYNSTSSTYEVVISKGKTSSDATITVTEE